MTEKLVDLLRDEDLLSLFEDREPSPAPHALVSWALLNRISSWALLMELITYSLALRKEMIPCGSSVENS